MSPFFITLFFVFVASATTINAQPKCGPNEVFVFCGSGCMKRSCQDINRPEPIVCPAVCLAECFCKEGYLRVSGNNSTCILARDCPPLPPTKDVLV